MTDTGKLKQEIQAWNEQAAQGKISYQELEQRIRAKGKELDDQFTLPGLTYQNLRATLLLIDTDGQEWRLFRGDKWRKLEEGKWEEGNPNLTRKVSKNVPRFKIPQWLVGAIGAVALLALLGFGLFRWVGNGSPDDPTGVEAAGVVDTPTSAPTPPPSPTDVISAEPTEMLTVEVTLEPTLPSAEEMTAVPTLEPTEEVTEIPAPKSTEGVTETPTPEPTPIFTSTSQVAPPLPPPPPSVPTPFGRIAYSVFDEAAVTYNLYLRSWPDIQAPPQIIEKLGQPAEQNGILVTRSWDGSKQGVALLDLASGNELNFIAIPEAMQPTLSATGDIAFAALRGNEWHIYINDYNRQLPVNGSIEGPSWLGNERIVFGGCVINDGCGIYTVNLDGSGLQQLTDSGQSRHCNPVVSPDGSQLAFMSNEGNEWNIYLISTNPSPGTAPTLLTGLGANDGLPAWAPDGRWLAYVTNEGNRWVMQMQVPDPASPPETLFPLEGLPGGFLPDGPPGQEQEAWLQNQVSWFN